MDAPAHQSWVAPLASANNTKATRVRITTTSFGERMSNIEFQANDVNGTGACSQKVSRPAGVLWISSAGPVVILLLLNNDRRDYDGQRRITNGCLNVTSGVNQRGEGTEKDC